MARKVRVDLEKVRRLYEEYQRINGLDIEDVEFFENGERLDIPAEYVKDWKFTGLGVVHFVVDEFYKYGWSVVR